MPILTRRGFVKSAAAGTATLRGSLSRLASRVIQGGHKTDAGNAASAGEFFGQVSPLEAELDRQEIYKLLGFATMSGEDPLRLWQRLKNTQTWRVGPVSPDSWSGSVFIADDADIFAFRTLSLPEAWLKESQPENRASYCGQHF